MSDLFNEVTSSTLVLKTSLNTESIQYTFRYVTNLEKVTNKYVFRYYTTGLSTSSIKYTFQYISNFEDTVYRYKFRYTTGRELISSTVRYLFRYNSNFANTTTVSYVFRYTTISPITETIRKIYRFRYETNRASNTSIRYKFRYTHSSFLTSRSSFVFKYISNMPYRILTSVVLLKNNDRTDALFLVRSQEALEDILVFSNLPKYQSVEFTIDKKKPNIDVLDTQSIKKLNIFEESLIQDSYTNYTYILVKNINDTEAISLDTYLKMDRKKTSSNLSYLFNLDQSSFINVTLSIKDYHYTHINYDSRYYNYLDLNFISDTVYPKFNKSGNCCLSQRITSSKNNTKCSPF